jgi:hypothetical protein
MRHSILALTALAMTAFAGRALALNITTQKGDAGRSGATLNETTLTLANVNSATFGKLFEQPVVGELYAQPLIVEGLPIAGGTHDVVFLATAMNNVYAFDATAAASPYWTMNFGPPVPASDVQCCGWTDVSTWIGIMGTPVIDAPSATMYLVARNKNADGTYHQWLHILDITTGLEKSGGPKEIVASVPGTGAGSVGGIINFDPKLQNQRSGMLLQNGRLYIAWASHTDNGNYHGWVMSYDAATLNQVNAFADTPNGKQAGIWMSGGGPVGDGTKIYLTTGNGTFNANSGGRDYGQSFLGLNSSLSVTTWFTPAAYNRLNGGDLDLGGAGVMLIPNTRLLLSGGKDGKLYLVNADNMGGFTNGRDACLQSFSTGSGHIHGGPVAWNGAAGQFVYVWPEDTTLNAYKLVGGLLQTTPARSVVSGPNGMPGGQLWVSANGTTDGIVWATHAFSGDANHMTQPGVLRAFDATPINNGTTLKEIYNSKQIAADDFGSFAKNPSPVVSNGRVYVPTFSGKLAVYGLH